MALMIVSVTIERGDTFFGAEMPGEVLDHLFPAQLLVQHHPDALIHCVYLKQVLCQADANSRNLQGGRSPQFSVADASTLAHLCRHE
jgi:hypothetical protein